ncbi:hypothetical protein C8R43DRAFT_873670 [Mycena crocata]|nr:hypothetical protein C8R43DRAFT_873670 [Mycena crocata]
MISFRNLNVIHCQAVSDIPHILFAEELIALYPEAKVILTNRSAESWCKSFQATVVEGPMKSNLAQTLMAWLDPALSAKSIYLGQLCFALLFKTDVITEAVAKEGFLAHYEEIRRLTPPSRLLEFEVAQGWEPLCKFLGKEIPKTEFPRVNDTAQLNKHLAAGRRKVLWKLAPLVMGPLLAVTAAATIAYAIRRRI